MWRHVMGNGIQILIADPRRVGSPASTHEFSPPQQTNRKEEG